MCHCKGIETCYDPNPTYSLWDEYSQGSAEPIIENEGEGIALPLTQNGVKSLADDHSHNNGGATDYYDFPSWVKCTQDMIEWREMNFSQGTMAKVVCTFNCGRHDATNYERELNKLIFYAQRELKRIKT